jgi:hypothetical protein
MIGFWDKSVPVRSNNDKVKATVYLKKDEILVAVANWSATDSSVKLDIDLPKLGFVPKSMLARGVSIDKYQPDIELDLNNPVTIPGGKGYLLIIK